MVLSFIAGFVAQFQWYYIATVPAGWLYDVWCHHLYFWDFVIMLAMIDGGRVVSFGGAFWLLIQRHLSRDSHF